MINNYILGLFATDGSLRKYKWKNQNKISYSEVLEMKDVDIIESVAEYFDTNVRKRTRMINNKTHTFYKTEISTKKINDYADYLKDNKKELYKYFISLKNKEQNELIRGMFDGDGGICKRGSNGCRCYFCANTKDGLYNIYEYWFEKNNIKYSKYYDKRGKGAYNYNIGNQKEIKKFANLIYDNSKIKLKRKHKIFVDNGFLSTEM